MNDASAALPAAVTADIVGGGLSDVSGITTVGPTTIAGETLDSGLENFNIIDQRPPRPKRVPNNKFNIAVIVAAALVFIVVIAWFEVIRVWLEYAFNTSTKLLFNKALGDTVYAAVATTISIFIIFLLVKFWIKID